MEFEINLKPIDLSKTFTEFHPMTVKKRKIEMYVKPLTFDTETSHNHNPENPLAWVYSWAICLDAESETALFGRTVTELGDAFKLIESELERLSNKYHACYKCLMYAHNLPYDYTYIYKHLKQRFIIKREFFLDRHHLLQAEIGEHIVLRDSLKYFNMSLEKACNTYNVKHKKLVGYVDYSLIHYSDEELDPEKDVKYQLNDVFGLQECLISDMEINGYNTTNIPMTSTGKIRNECRESAYLTDDYRKEFIKTKPTPRQYKYMRRIFCGGYCHGNRFHRGKTVFDYIIHRDFRSHYPTIMRKYTFPSGRIREIKKPAIADFFRNGFNTWGMIGFVNLRLKNKKDPVPYLSRSKCDSNNAIFTCDNGRVLECDGRCITYVTEFDLEIILEQYDFDGDPHVLRAWTSKSEPLPKWFIDKIDLYYKKKSDLKKRVNDLKRANASRDEIFDAEIDLLKSKNFLNGLYGLTAMDYCKPDFTRSECDKVKPDNIINYENKINSNYGVYRSKQDKNKYWISRTSSGFLNIAWSMYVTSCARYELFKCIRIITDVNPDLFLYCDTDSCYYCYDEKVEKAFEELNKTKYDNAIKNGLFIKTDTGDVVTYDSFDREDTGTEFRFLHSKCYGYITKNELTVTVSGVSGRTLDHMDGDKPVYFYNSDELMTLKNLKDGFVFRRCGSSKIKYVEHDFQLVPVDKNGHLEQVGDMAIISENEKTLSIGNDEFIKNYFIERFERGIIHS